MCEERKKETERLGTKHKLSLPITRPITYALLINWPVTEEGVQKWEGVGSDIELVQNLEASINIFIPLYIYIYIIFFIILIKKNFFLIN